ncbi:hypothetical protein [uncultured Tateyamaria sp.]|uniref:hypothetical protein n=1 Tax=uncultured Tateyamaria sp. TaxID=455651 RepID=UPI002616028D|nr:hypothetical protein [uncultured Tateyamaria sp.]
MFEHFVERAFWFRRTGQFFSQYPLLIFQRFDLLLKGSQHGVTCGFENAIHQLVDLFVDLRQLTLCGVM